MKPRTSPRNRAVPSYWYRFAASVSAWFGNHQHLLRYFVIGCSASALDVIVFVCLNGQFNLTELSAQMVSVTTAVVFSFVTNARHNFKVIDRMALRLTSFILVCAFGGLIGYCVIVGAISLGLDATMGKLLSLPVVFITQYVLNSKITFRRNTAGV